MENSQLTKQNVPEKKGCGCGNNTPQSPVVLLAQIKKRQDKIYKTKAKIF